MPSVNTKLDVNVLVTVSKRFIKDVEVKNNLQQKYDWNTPRLSFKGKTVSRSEEDNVVMYGVILDDVPAITLSLKEGCLKYVGPIETGESNSTEEVDQFVGPVVTEDLLEDAVQEAEDEEEEIDLNPVEGWTAGEVYFDNRLTGDSFQHLNSKINLDNAKHAKPLDYFLFFLPLDHFRYIINNINTYAVSVDSSWTDVSFNEYLMWISLLTIMTVIKHDDRKAYWHQGSSHFLLNINFSTYMSYKRFNDITTMHIFEIHSVEMQQRDPLYQIRRTIEAFNNHMEKCVTPGKYLVIDESMNQWLGTGMPNLKKVPRKPHPIGQEFKTLADHHSYCILRLDTVSDPKSKEFDQDPGMRKLTATVKRLVKPWFGSGRTVIADSWFGSPEMTRMLLDLGLYSIMQVTKRRYWPRGMPETDIVERVDAEHGSYFTMKKDTGNGKIFVCAYRDQKVKAFVSSCGTTRLTGQRTFVGSRGNLVTIKRPEVVHEYETHKSKTMFV